MPESDWDMFITYLKDLLSWWYALIPGILLSVFDVVERARKERPPIEPKWIIRFLVAGIVVAQFLTYRDFRKECRGATDAKQREVDRLTGQLKDLNEPQITTLFEHQPLFIAPGGARGDEAIITAFLTIKNAGAPTFVSDWNVLVTTEEGNTFEVTSILSPQTGITVKDTRGGSITLKASDYLPFKAGDQPIPRNGMVEGFVIGVAGLPKSEVVKKDTR